MQWLPDNILDLVAGLIGLGTFLYTVWSLLIRRWLFNRRLVQMERRLSARPTALALGIGRDIEGAVKRFLHDQDLLIPLEAYHWPAPRGSKFVPKADFPGIVDQLHAIKQTMIDRSVTEIHLFYFGPVSMAVAVGNVFRNLVPIKTYNFVSPEGGYELDLIIQRDGSLFSGALRP